MESKKSRTQNIMYYKEVVKLEICLLYVLALNVCNANANSIVSLFWHDNLCLLNITKVDGVPKVGIVLENIFLK